MNFNNSLPNLIVLQEVIIMAEKVQYLELSIYFLLTKNQRVVIESMQITICEGKLHKLLKNRSIQTYFTT